MDNRISPLRESKRLVWIDAIRGFAIFGIFMVNIRAFSAPYFMYGEVRDLAQLNRMMQVIIDIFFQASFYTLFSILFGFGMQMMKERIETRQESLYPILFRRMAILLCFGTIHAFVLWHGDILFSYSITGFLLIFLLHLNKRTQLTMAMYLLGITVAFISWLYYVTRDYLGYPNKQAIDEAIAHYQSSSLSIIWKQNYQDWMYSNSGMGFLFLLIVLLSFFLMGVYIAKKKWLHEPKKHRNTLIKVWILSLILFIGLKMGPYMFSNPLWFSYIQDNVGGVASAVFYIVSMTLLAQSRLGMKLIMPFTYVGRMALTNYILQSLLSFILFYGVGFGLYDAVSPIVGTFIVVLVYILQTMFSKWWLTHFRFGPLEWLWRSLTYWKKQPFKRERSTAR
mgnify:CR=1 FL=1